MRIYVGNLSYATGEAELQQLFAGIGEVGTVQLIRDRATGQSKGFGFVEMINDNEARTACETLNQQEVDGRRLTVNEAKPQERNGGFGRSSGARQPREARW